MKVLFLVSLLLLSPFFLQGKIPIPADITVGLYYPWLNQKWGNSVGVPVKNPLMSDVVSIIYQWRLAAVDSLKNGQFPLWHNSYFLGMPLFANFQSSVVNFTNFFFFLPLSPGTSWGLMIWLQLLFSLCSAYIFLKTCKFSFFACLSGSLVYAFSLFSIVWLEYGVHNYTAAFLPLMLAVIKSRRPLLFFSLLAALQIFSGYPQYAIYSLGFSFLYFLVTSPKVNFRSFFRFFVALLLSLGLAAPILLPGYELIRLSINRFDLTAASSSAGFLPVVNLLTVLSPNFFGNPATADYFGQGFYDNNAFYPGLIALIAFIFSLVVLFRRQSSRETVFFSITIIIVALLVVANPFSVFLKNNFGFIMAKNGLATRFFILSNLSFSFLAGWFINFLGQKHFPRSSLIISLSLIFLWLVSLLVFSKISYSAHFVAFKNTLYVFLFAFPLALSLLFYRRSFIVFLLLFIELFYYGRKYLPFSPEKYLFPPTPTTTYLQQNSNHFRLATLDTIPENMWAPYGLKTIDGYDTLVPWQNYQYLSLANQGNFPTSAYRAAKLVNFSNTLPSRAAVKYALKQTTTPDIIPTELPKSFTPVFSEGRVGVYQNQSALPRARLVNQFIVSSSADETARLLPSLPLSATILHQSVDFSSSTLSSCIDNQEKADFVLDSPNRVIISTNSRCPRLLVLADAFYPGWHAATDRQTATIYRADHAFRAIFLPPGNHRVEFSYFPQSLKIGLIIMLSSLIVWLWLKKLSW